MIKRLLILLILASPNLYAVTPVFCCGFECGNAAFNNAASVGEHWRQNGVGTNVAFSTTTVRNGARSMRFNPAADNNANVTCTAFSSSNTFVARFAVRWTTMLDKDQMICTGNTNFAGVNFKQSDSKLYATYGGASPTYGATGASVTTGQWYVVDVKVNMSANPWTIDVKVDGVALGQATNAVAAATETQVRIGCGISNTSTADMFIDDFILSTTDADYPFGDGYVNHFVPTSDVSHNVAGANDFDRTLTGTDITNSTTDAYLLVDAIPFIATDISADACVTITAPPNAGDFVQCQFGPAPGIGTPTTGPRAVEVIGSLQTASSGGSPTMDLSLRINDNGTTGDVFVSSVFYAPSTPVFKRAHFATAPSTGVAWTAALFNALRVRFGSYDAADSAPDGYFGATMVEAEFAVVASQPGPTLRRVIID